MSLQDHRGNPVPQAKIVDFIRIGLRSDGQLEFSGTTLAQMTKTNVLLSKAITDYNATKLWEKVAERQSTAIRPPSEKEKSQFGG